MSISLLSDSFLGSVDCEEYMMCDETGESILLGEKSSIICDVTVESTIGNESCLCDVTLETSCDLDITSTSHEDLLPSCSCSTPIKGTPERCEKLHPFLNIDVGTQLNFSYRYS